MQTRWDACAWPHACDFVGADARKLFPIHDRRKRGGEADAAAVIVTPYRCSRLYHPRPSNGLTVRIVCTRPSLRFRQLGRNDLPGKNASCGQRIPSTHTDESSAHAPIIESEVYIIFSAKARRKRRIATRRRLMRQVHSHRTTKSAEFEHNSEDAPSAPATTNATTALVTTASAPSVIPNGFASAIGTERRRECLGTSDLFKLIAESIEIRLRLNGF